MSTENPGLSQEDNLIQPASVSPESEPSSLPDVQVKAKKSAPRRTFSIAYKLKVLEESDACDNALARGALLRREGLYYSQLSGWRKQRDDGKLGAKAKGKTPKALLMNQQLSRENAQLKKKLAQAEAVIALQKKVSELLGEHILQPENSEAN